MNLKHGDIITLDNGDRVKVSLDVIAKKVTELVIGKHYQLKKDGKHCHTISYNGDTVDFNEVIFQYVGEVDVMGGKRYIFYSNDNLNSAYTMFTTENLDFVVREITK